MVRLTNSKAALTYESISEVNLSSDEDLVNVSGALGLATRVAEATVILDGRRLICDFEESTAKGHTNATFPVSDLVRVAIPLMQSVDESTHEKLVDLGTQPIVGPDGGEQLVIDFAGERTNEEEIEETDRH